jgi:hypothetical protein
MEKSMSALIRQVALVSIDSRISAATVMRISAALQKQATRDLAQIWDISATVDAFDRLGDIPVGTWPIIIGGNVPPGAAGFHTTNDGQPMALVQASEDADQLCLVCSHEMLEMLVDPSGSRFVPGDSPKPDQGRVSVLVEVCDPCEAAEFGYTVNNLLVSDFYTPNYFDPVQSPGVRYSFTGAITEPRQVLRGGYLSWQDPVSKHYFQEIKRGSDEPDFEDLGILADTRITPREFIDRKTNKFTMTSVKEGRRAAAMASSLNPDKLAQATAAQAQVWEEVLEKLQVDHRGERDREGHRGMAAPAVRRAPQARKAA